MNNIRFGFVLLLIVGAVVAMSTFIVTQSICDASARVRRSAGTISGLRLIIGTIDWLVVVVDRFQPELNQAGGR